VTLALRVRVREAIEAVIEDELAAALGCAKGERSANRAGDRHGHGGGRRKVLTEYGPAELLIPKARLRNADGSTSEWHSSVLPRYQRRTQKVDAALLGTYLADGNTRRLRTALAPLLGQDMLSRSAISRITGRLHTLFDEWRRRDLRRRTKTQGSFRQESSALVLLWGLVAFGQIKLRKIDGWKDMTKSLKLAWQEAA
jgi:transposase-like protein